MGLEISGSEGANGSLTVQSEAEADVILLDVPPFLADFTSDGRILVAEGDRQLGLYNSDGTRVQLSLSSEDEVIVDILGGSPTFVLTNTHIYQFSNEKLEKLGVLLSPLEEIVGMESGDLTPGLESGDLKPGNLTDEALSGRSIDDPVEIWQGLTENLNIWEYFSVENFPRSYAPSSSVSFHIPDALKSELGNDFQRFMKSALFAPSGKLFAALGSDIVMSLPDQQGRILLHNTRFPNQKNDFTQYPLLHVPKPQDIALIRPDAKRENVFLLTKDDDILHVDEKNSMQKYDLSFYTPPRYRATGRRRLERPRALDDGPIDFMIVHDPVKSLDSLFLFDNSNRLWQRNNEKLWELKLRSRGSPVISGILPDKQGILIAGDYLYDNASVMHISYDGQITPYVTTEETGSFGYPVQNGMVADEKSNIWMITSTGVFVIPQGTRELRLVKETSWDRLPHIITHRSDILISAGDEGLWVFNNDVTAFSQHLDGQTVIASAIFPTSEEGQERVWVGGPDLFAVLDEEFFEISIDHLDALRSAFEVPDNKGIIVQDITPGEDGVIIVTSAGDAYGYFEAEEFIVQPVEWAERKPRPFYGYSATIFAQQNGQLLFAEADTLWKYVKENNRFQIVATADFEIATLAETAGGELLVGGTDDRLYALRNNKIVPYIQKLTEEHIPGSFRSVIALTAFQFIILSRWSDSYDLYFAELDADARFSFIHHFDEIEEIAPWKQYVQFSDSQFFLLHNDNTVSLFTLGDVASQEKADIQTVELQDDLYKLAYPVTDDRMRNVYILGKEAIWEFSSATGNVKRRCSLPVGAAALEDEMEFSVDTNGIWLGSENGLWRYEFGASAEKETWLRFSETDGLPSGIIEAVVSRGDTEALIVTQAGLCQAKRGTDYWRFISQTTPGISGTVVKHAALFLLEDKLTLALGTDEGISIVRWLQDDWENRKWTHFDHSSGLLSNDIHSLHWNEEYDELWVGLKDGVVILSLIVEPDGSVREQKPIITLTPESGLPAGEVTGITTSEDGQNAWILTKTALSRWKRGYEGDYQLLHTEPCFFQETAQLKLGPSVDGKSPKILVRDYDLNWSVWNPGAFIRPRLIVKNWFFWYTTHLIIESLSPELEESGRWGVEYRLDLLDREPGRSWGLPLDFWRDTGSHYMIASVKSEDDVEYRATAPIPRAPSYAYRVVRIIILFLMLCMVIGSLLWYLRMRQIRAHRLRRREIPYIQGEAIKDAGHFFGRQDLLMKLQNTITTTNYALVGEFRIGKTSIQFRLKELLKSLEDPKYTFLSVFVDLQLLRLPRETYFFHFLGTHLLELSQEYEIPPNIVDKLYIRQIEEDADYKSIHLKNDLDELFEFLEQKYPERPPLILFQIDEITLMNDYDTLLKLRALLIREPRFKVILSGRGLYKDPGRDTVSPWWNIFQEIEVEPLTPSEARKLIANPVKGLFQFDDEAIEHITARSQGMPLAIQIMCTNVLHYKYNAEKFTTRITVDDLYASLELAKQQESASDTTQEENFPEEISE